MTTASRPIVWVLLCRVCQTMPQEIVSKQKPAGNCLICARPLTVRKRGEKR